MKTLDRNLLAASRRAAIDGLVIENPRSSAAHAAFDLLIEHGLLRDGMGKRCVLLVGPSQSGKSTILESYAAIHNTAEARDRGEIPVLHVTLEANVTRKGLAQNILEAVEEHGLEAGSDRGSETVLLKRVRTCLKACKVKLLILDEFHHLLHSESERLASSVGETIKRLLIKGVCPIVLSGVETARLPLDRNIQLRQRAEPAIELAPLRPQSPEDVDLLAPFLRAFCEGMSEVAGIENAMTLLDLEVVANMITVTGGVLGAVCNLIKGAVVVATVAGRSHLTRDDLDIAAQRYFVDPAPREEKKENPFRRPTAMLQLALE